MSKEENIYKDIKLHLDDDKYIDFEKFDNMFEEIKEILKDSTNKDTGIMNAYLAGYISQKTAEIFDIINTNERIKYAVSRLELKKNMVRYHNIGNSDE